MPLYTKTPLTLNHVSNNGTPEKTNSVYSSSRASDRRLIHPSSCARILKAFSYDDLIKRRIKVLLSALLDRYRHYRWVVIPLQQVGWLIGRTNSAFNSHPPLNSVPLIPFEVFAYWVLSNSHEKSVKAASKPKSRWVQMPLSYWAALGPELMLQTTSWDLDGGRVLQGFDKMPAAGWSRW